MRRPNVNCTISLQRRLLRDRMPSQAKKRQVVLGRVACPSMNPCLHQSELMMEAAGTNVTLHFSIN